MSNQFPIKKTPKEYFLFWVNGKVKQIITGPLPIQILQFKRKDCQKQIQYKKGKLVIRTKEGVQYE